MKLKTIHYFILIMVVAIAGIFVARVWSDSQPGEYDEFAQCINDADATFYGAFWCPHCDEQKQMFGNSERLLPYTECSTPDGQNQTQVCIDAEIKSYPTWEFADGSRQTGVMSFRELSEKTNCSLPS